MDEILHHLETMGNNLSWVFTGESSFQGFLGGAGFRPSTVGLSYGKLAKHQPTQSFSVEACGFLEPWP